MALYNNGYPATYAQYYPQYQPVMPQPVQPVQQTPPQQSQQNGVIWVQGEAGMKAYLVAPNTTVQLWDSERQTIYLKSADASGMPSVKTLDYVIRDTEQPKAPVAAKPPENYATKEDVDALYGQISALRAEIDGLTIRRAPAKSRKEPDDE